MTLLYFTLLYWIMTFCNPIRARSDFYYCECIIVLRLGGHDGRAKARYTIRGSCDHIST